MRTIKKGQKGAMLKQAPRTTIEEITSTKLKDVPRRAINLGKRLINNTINDVKNATVGDVAKSLVPTGVSKATKRSNKKPDRVLAAMAKKNGGKVAKAKDGKWMQKAAASIKRRGTAGKCTPITKPGCTGKAKALAKTFKKIAKSNKKK
jgi:hypothetical protein